MRRAFLTGAVSAFGIGSTNGFAQRSGQALTAMSQVAGQWKGVATPGNVALTMDVDEAGMCTISSSSGSDKGTAQVEGGILIIRFITQRGQATLELVDHRLQGVMVIRTRSSAVTFTKI